MKKNTRGTQNLKEAVKKAIKSFNAFEFFYRLFKCEKNDIFFNISEHLVFLKNVDLCPRADWF